MSNKDISKSGNNDISAFVAKVAAMPTVKTKTMRGKLIFALDATASREHTWDQACHLQGQMFSTAAELGGLDIQVCYYRGFLEFDHSAWCHDSEELETFMRRVYCVGGQTQIERVLQHALSQAKAGKVNAVVFVGDCMEENPERVQQLAGQLALFNVPLFMFQEGFDPLARTVFQDLARLTKGAYCAFDIGSAEQLKRLLQAVSVYASGGKQALEDFNAKFSKPILKLTHS